MRQKIRGACTPSMFEYVPFRNAASVACPNTVGRSVHRSARLVMLCSGGKDAHRPASSYSLRVVYATLCTCLWWNSMRIRRECYVKMYE